jgi:hypothetical protein
MMEKGIYPTDEQLYSVIYLTLMGLVGWAFIAQILIDKIWKE